MSLFQNLFKPPAPAAPPPPKVPPVPTQLPKITAPTAAEITKTSQPSPPAQALLTPQQTPSQYLGALQEKHLGTDMVKTMAHGMPDREGVWWASQSAQKVSDKLPPSDVHAMNAAQAWVKNPTPANKAAAADAASKTDHRGPGAWAAQGAAWSQPASPAGATAAPRLTPHAVTGAVLSAAAIKANPALATPALKAPTLAAPTLKAPQLAAPQTPQVPQAPLAPQAPQAPPPAVPPAVQVQTFKEQHPFIALGMDIASGKNSWA